MPQIIKTSTSDGKSTIKTSIIDSGGELGINEPVLNPTMAGAIFRYKGKLYRYDDNEEIMRFYPPDEKHSRTKTNPKS